MRSALAYTPGTSALHTASAGAAIAFLASFALLAFVYSNPLVLTALGIAVAVAGIRAGAGRTVAGVLRLGASLALMMVVVNGLVTERGLTVVARLGEVPLAGRLDVTLESLVAGGVIGLRIVVVLLAFGVYSACVDPDAVLRLLRPVARRSALTATLVARLVPVAVADAARLREGAALRGPAAAPVGRAPMARRLVAGSLDRAVDLAATLELRGYELPAVRVKARPRGSRGDGRLLAAAAIVAASGLAARLAGAGDFETYPQIALDAGAATIALSLALAALGWGALRD